MQGPGPAALSRRQQQQRQQEQAAGPESTPGMLRYFQERVLPALLADKGGSLDTAAASKDGGPVFAQLERAAYWREPQPRQPGPDTKPEDAALWAMEDAELARQRGAVDAHLSSKEFEKRKAALAAQPPSRGIVICAGGPKYLPQAVMLLRILRRELNCTLPVELFWLGEAEMDNASLKALQREFGPLEGRDLELMPYPAHHRPGADLRGFPLKPYALLFTSFTEALLLDADVVPARDPSFLFEDATFRRYGSLFWPDRFGDGTWFNPAVFPYVGLDPSVLGLINAGKGSHPRDAETGQLLVNRAMHLDALEWAFFLNTFRAPIYELCYGDKDTFSVGFGLAGKPGAYRQVDFPPSGVFTYIANLPPAKRTEAEGPARRLGGWALVAFMQFDPQGRPLLIHRCEGEAELHQPAPVDDIVSAPMPISWAEYFMWFGQQNATAHPLQVLPLNVSQLAAEGWQAGEACPLAAWSAYWQLRTHAIPIDRDEELERACDGALLQQYGRQVHRLIHSHGLLEFPARIAINAEWDAMEEPGNFFRFPAKHPQLLAVPINVTAAQAMAGMLDRAARWTSEFADRELPILPARPTGSKRKQGGKHGRGGEEEGKQGGDREKAEKKAAGRDNGRDQAEEQAAGEEKARRQRRALQRQQVRDRQQQQTHWRRRTAEASH